MSEIKQKVMMIGLDSMTWDVLDPIIAKGVMPRLDALRKGGTSGILQSTEPPVTPAAWSTMMTGVMPGKHGVLGFEDYNSKNNSLKLSGSGSIRCETMWSYLGRLDYKVVSLNLPHTYPPFKINGIMVAGYGSPGIEYNSTYPSDFKEKVLKRIPDYDLLGAWEDCDIADSEKFLENLQRTQRIFDQSVELAELASEQTNWDVMMVELQQTDRILHKIWTLLTPAGWEQYPHYEQPVMDMFKRLDDVIGKLADMAGNDGLVFVISDHGHGPIIAKIKPNCMLKEWGYLVSQRWMSRTIQRLKKNVTRMFGGKSHKKNYGELATKLSLEWSKTKAIIAHTAHDAFLHINLEGRQKDGTVPAGQYDSIVAELKQHFTKVTDPKNGQKLFSDAKTPEEIYGKDYQRDDNSPDLILIPGNGYLPVRSLKGDGFMDSKQSGMAGCHRPEGMYVVAGAGIKTSTKMEAHICDVVPTIYAALGVAIPDHIEGNVLKAAFSEPVEVKRQQANGSTNIPSSATAKPSANLSDDEEDMIKQRLNDLGYLE